MNPFQTEYGARLVEWKGLRISLSRLDLAGACGAVDNWWQQAPLVNHHLHPLDPGSWPDPWTLLSENIWCTLTRAVGVCYTLALGGIEDFQILQANNSIGEEHNLVVVGGAKYIINYYPRSMLSITLKDFTVHRTLDTSILKQKIK